VLRIEQADGGWHGVVSSGGHPLPLLRADTGEVRRIGYHGTLLGVLDEVQLHDCEFRLDPGDCAVLFTDGVTEGRRGNEFFDDERVWRLVSQPHESAGALVTALLEAVLAFQHGDPRDDIAIAALRALPGAPA
jgi:sigma-B regulation protein RsbU (phosphoserine phosphatase)